jgi:hypothetical protein
MQLIIINGQVEYRYSEEVYWMSSILLSINLTKSKRKNCFQKNDAYVRILTDHRGDYVDEPVGEERCNSQEEDV